MYNAKFGLVIEKLTNLKRSVATNLGEGVVTSELEDVRVRVENLAYEFNDQFDYSLTVTRKDLAGGVEDPLLISLPEAIANLAIAAQDKPTYTRTMPEQAASVLIAHLADRIYEDLRGSSPGLSPRYVRINPAVANN
jgi:hypothetical protein